MLVMLVSDIADDFSLLTNFIKRHSVNIQGRFAQPNICFVSRVNESDVAIYTFKVVDTWINALSGILQRQKLQEVILIS